MKKVILVIGVILAVMAFSAYAEQVKRNARVIEIKGSAEVKSGKGNWTAAKVGTILQQGDFIRTKGKSTAVLELEGEVETAKVEVQSDSQLLIAELKEDKVQATQNTLLDLALGKVLITAQKLHAQGSKFEVKTPTSVVGVRGTRFAVSVEAAE